MIAVTSKNKPVSDELIRRGKIEHLLSVPQKRFYDVFKNPANRSAGLYGSRKIGKSFSLMLILWNHAQQHPNSMIRVVLPLAKMAKDIYEPIFSEMKGIWPADIYPRWMRSESKLIFANGSVIAFGGAARDQLDSNRGPRSDVVVIDEAPACDDGTMHELIYKILRPQLTTSKNPKFLYTGTPPETADHYFIRHVYPELQSKGQLVVATIDENNLLTDEQKRQIEEDYGGRSSKAFRREYLAELIGNDDLLLVPDFDPEAHTAEEADYTNEFGQPGHFQSFQALDAGLVDGSGFLLGFYNHYKDTLYIIDEHLEAGLTTRQLSEIWREKEDILRANPDRYAPPSQIIDIMEQSAADLRREHGVSFRRPRKGKLEEQIGYLRSCFEQDKIVILKSCTGLIAQLQNAVWSDSATELKKVARSETYGHYDLVAALTYLTREVLWGRGPGETTVAQALQFSGGKSR